MATNFYFFQVDAKTVIDGTSIGNISRFLNHSCSANCHTMKWNVCGHHRLGIFASVDIKKGEQLTYDYQFEVKNVEEGKKRKKRKKRKKGQRKRKKDQRKRKKDQ